MTSDPQSQPLVSVGIPTYNRPDSLRHTLRCITRQTYRRLEIIVSDNASPDAAVEAVVRDFMADDPRIQYFKQAQNRGIVPNYQFTLAQASGEFFMWAADDDEWDERFIEHCVSHIGGATSYMPGYRFLFTHTGRAHSPPLVRLPPGFPRGQAMRLFFARSYVHILYALHRRESIRFVLSDPPLDAYDTYFSIRILLEGEVVIDPSVCLFTVITRTAEYEVKEVVNPKQKLAGCRNAFVMGSKLFLQSRDLSWWQKMEFLGEWWEAVLCCLFGGAKKTHPLTATLALSLGRLVSIPGRISRSWSVSRTGSLPGGS